MLEDSVPDATVLCRFRVALNNKNAFENLQNIINHQLEQRGVIIKRDCIVDASAVNTLLKPKGKKVYEIVEDRNEENTVISAVIAEKVAGSVDKDAAWLKKGNQLHFGYKKHVCTNQDGYILALHTTAANVKVLLRICIVF